MIVLSLALVIAAAVALFVGLFVTTGLTFIWIAIGLCLVSLLLLWFGTRSRKTDAPAAPSPPVYGGTRPGTTSSPVRRATAADDEAEDDVREAEVDELDQLTAPAGDDVVRATSARDRAAARVAESAPEPAAGSEDEESSVQVVPPTEATAKKATAKKAAAGTTGKAARDRLGQIPGVGPAKQKALLDQYGSLEGIRDAPVDDIVGNVKGFGPALASRVKDSL